MAEEPSGEVKKFKNNCKLRRKIYDLEDFERFKSSECLEGILDFISDLATSVVGKTLRDEIACSNTVDKIYEILEKLESFVDEYPPQDQKGSRFGNKAFRDWYRRVADESSNLLAGILPAGNVREVRGYLISSFGHPGRIDYGTGHELNFIIVILCLSRLGLLKREDYPGAVLKVFWRYVILMRKLFVDYWLEPAGSQGVWGLDDYCFLPFLFGAAQLRDHKYLRPKSTLNDEYLDEFKEDYMYFSSIKFINSVKTAPFEICSPLLYDISAVKTWAKVCSGLLKMYRDQVLEKLPVIQHLKFGSIVMLDHASPEEQERTDSPSSDDLDENPNRAHSAICGHPTGFPDCCGIRIPSSVAASTDDQRKGVGACRRRLNFIPND